MVLPQQKLLRHDLLRAQQELSNIERIQGKGSPEYMRALKQLARIWSVLKMTRSREDFLQEIMH